MTRLLLAVTLAAGLCSATGCAMCCRTYDDAYAAYGGCRQRGDLYHGRVGSASYDAGMSAPYASSEEAAMYLEHVPEGASVVYGEPEGYHEELTSGAMMYGDGAMPEDGVVYRSDPALRTPTQRDVDRAVIAEGGFQIVDGKVWIDGEPVDGEVWIDGRPLDRRQMPVAHNSMSVMRQASPVRGPSPAVYGQAAEEAGEDDLAPVVEGRMRTARGMRPLEPTPQVDSSRAAATLWQKRLP